MNTSLPTNASITDRHELTQAVKAAGKHAGFDLVGIAHPITPPGFDRLKKWLDLGFAGEMQYLPRRAHAYEHPEHVMPDVRSIVMLALNYKTDDTRLPATEESSPNTSARVAQYARGTLDYHDLIRGKLKILADELHRLRPGCRTRGVVDTAPLLERDFARLAGLGWFGKNTMLINKHAGSWLFLAALLTDLDLEADSVHETSHCGTCTRCLDVCPTEAFPEPYVLDDRRCISYLTIEHRTAIPMELREGIGNWVFGCDLCQDVCPWNRKAGVTCEPALQPQIDLNPADALVLFQLSETEFVSRFAQTPLARPGWEGLRRNAAIVLGNSADTTVIPVLEEGVTTASPVVRETIEWAVAKLRSHE